MIFYDPESFCDFLQLSFLVFSEIMFRSILEITKYNQIPFFSIEKLINRCFIWFPIRYKSVSDEPYIIGKLFSFYTTFMFFVFQENIGYRVRKVKNRSGQNLNHGDVKELWCNIRSAWFDYFTSSCMDKNKCGRSLSDKGNVFERSLYQGG